MFDFFDKIIDFCNFIINFINVISYDFVLETFEVFLIFIQLAFIDYKEWAFTLATDTAKELIDSLDLSSSLMDSYSALDSKLLSIMAFLNIPTAFNTIISAMITRFILGFARL